MDKLVNAAKDFLMTTRTSARVRPAPSWPLPRHDLFRDAPRPTLQTLLDHDAIISSSSSSTASNSNTLLPVEFVSSPILDISLSNKHSNARF
ncbi:hypothetical protein NM208_g15584 [Fusarium decemcellulare]|uniref:Uncharacterized protein n=1 Tax=Fusarium decemcellulare TaxID=57161 RepID=A0ACC1RG20_9HYPO|nr:hypothetical protein NM208_g15584 [Fusarium decemcellulare]